MNSSSRRNIRFIGIALISVAAYFLLGYSLQRSQFGWFIAIFAVVFVQYFLLMREEVDNQRLLKWGLALAVVFRLLLIASIPQLSDDVYRFIWDGNLWVHGINPFLHTPSALMDSHSYSFLSDNLFSQLNSAGYYSVYPPISQFVYGFSALLFGNNLLGNIITMRIFIIAAEFGSIWVLIKLLKYYKLPQTYVLLYALNPLIIIELSGSLHFEALMIFFLLFAFYLYLNSYNISAAVAFAIAVNVKLIPLLLVPYLLFSLTKRQAAYFLGILGVITGLLHLPFINATFVYHFWDSLDLYFQKFEFNASLYYLVRWVGWQVKGYNIIQSAGPIMAIISTVTIVGASWKFRDRSLRNLPLIYIIALTVYYLFSTTIHPWYISSLLAFVPLTGLLFPIAWSALIPLTYITYMTSAYTENLWLIALEYLIVTAVIVYDYRKRNDTLNKKMDFVFFTP